ncbi:MAG: alpha/beta hydrolase [Chitinophagales bacterium]|nr:alpha/beta hydrolase [Chitinophagales bacterium]
MKTLYLFPGLGADETIFRKLHLPGYEIVHIKWIKPLNKETLPEYAKRLVYQIRKDTEPVLIGLSFGGMVAQEVAKIIDPALTIIISSIKTYHERPFQMILAEKLGVSRFIPTRLAIEFEFWYYWAFGPTTRMEKAFIKQMALNVHPDFTDWAAHTAISWRNEELVPNVVHIHGDRDNLFPHWYIRNFILIKGGTHFMVYNRADEVAAIILDKLSKLEEKQQYRMAV